MFVRITLVLIACGWLTACEHIAGIGETDDIPTGSIEIDVVGLRAAVSVTLRTSERIEQMTLTEDGVFAVPGAFAIGTQFAVSVASDSACVLEESAGLVQAAQNRVSLVCDGVLLLADLELSGPSLAEQWDFQPEQLEYQLRSSILQQDIEIQATAAYPDIGIAIQAWTDSVQHSEDTTPIEARLTPGDNTIEITTVHDAGLTRTHEIHISRDDALSQHAYVKAAASAAADGFGGSLDLHGDTLVVGAPGEDSGATGVNGDPDDDRAEDSGAVYVFRWRAGFWAQEAYIKASNTEAGDRFGHDVAIWGDLLAVSAIGEDSATQGVNGNQSSNDATDSGAVYVFRRQDDSWEQEAYIKASDTDDHERYGFGIALWEETLAVSAVEEDGRGSIHIHGRVAPSWNLEKYIYGGSSNYFGWSIALWDDTLAVGVPRGASEEGEVEVFRKVEGTWSEEYCITASNPDPDDRFGHSVALSGDVLAVGATGEDSAAVGLDGDQQDNSSPDSGAVYLFERQNSFWKPTAYVKAIDNGSSDQFGAHLAISGDMLVLGSALHDSSGAGVGPTPDDDALADSGTATVYVHRDGRWKLETHIKASNAGSGDQFGGSLALGAGGLVVGAPFEDSGATGIDGDDDDTLADSGAVYVFH